MLRGNEFQLYRRLTTPPSFLPPQVTPETTGLYHCGVADAWNVSLCGVAGRGWSAVAVNQGKLRAEFKPCSKKVSGAFSQGWIYIFGGPRLDTVLGPCPLRTFCSSIAPHPVHSIHSSCCPTTILNDIACAVEIRVYLTT